MADNNTDYTTTAKNTDIPDDTEPATAHDVGIGGGLGAVGGAIVGGLAGGPIGAIIGAIAGGAVSAGAVDIVDKHDHDNPGATATTANTGYAATDAPVATDTAYTDTEPVTPAYADTRTATNMPAMDIDTDRTVQLHEEVLNARTEQVKTGEVSLHKEVVTEMQSIDVPVTREEVVIERHAATGNAAVGSFDTNTDEVIRVPVMEEQVTIEKTPVVVEEVSLGKRQVTETQHVSDTVRREEAYIDNPGNVVVSDKDAK